MKETERRIERTRVQEPRTQSCRRRSGSRALSCGFGIAQPSSSGPDRLKPAEEIAADLLWRDAATDFVGDVSGRKERRRLLSRKARARKSQAHIPVELARAIDHAPLAADGELLLAKSA